MRRAWMAVAAMLFASTFSFAQEPLPQAPQIVFPQPEMGPVRSTYRIYGQAEYLVWWMTRGPNPVPLLTTGNPAVDGPDAGILGFPSTRVLFGGDNIGLGTFNGGRFTLGAWLGDEQTFGIEGSGYFLGTQTRQFGVASDATGAPLLGIPFRNLQGQEERLLVSNPPGGALAFALAGVGSASASYRTEFWGMEINGLLNLVRDNGRRFDLLLGYSHRRFKEDLSLTATLQPVTDPFTGLTFGGTARDSFSAINEFDGAQLGARIGLQRDRLSIDFTAKVGLGNNHRTVDVQGASSFNGTFPGGPPTSPFGIFAQQSNIGSRSQDHFAAIPELNVQAGYDLSSRVRVFAGYNMIYWGDVVRPGNQIDRTLNNPAGGINGQHFFTGLQRDIPPGPGAPLPQHRTSNLWVHGLNFGLEFRF